MSTIQRRIIIFILLFTLILSACQPASLKTMITSEEAQGLTFSNSQLLVDVDWLNKNLDNDQIRIIDMRSQENYLQGHITGAANVQVSDISSTINNIGVEFDQNEVKSVIEELGVKPDTTIVIYDDLGMMSSGRMFWTLEYIGHQEIKVLHGGWNDWENSGFKITDEIPVFETTIYPIKLQTNKIVTADEIIHKLDDPNTVFVDARSPQEYTGEVKSAERGGHIPGAVNFNWQKSLSGGDTTFTTNSNWQEELKDPDVEYFLPADEIQFQLDELGIEPKNEIIVYCQTMWRAAHVYYLLRLMGYDHVRGYDGSWAEWGNDPSYPIVQGEQPG